jgi:hypothetical protein
LVRLLRRGNRFRARAETLRAVPKNIEHLAGHFATWLHVVHDEYQLRHCRHIVTPAAKLRKKAKFC